MSNFSYPRYEPSKGYMTEQIQFQYINKAVAKKQLPENADRMAHIIRTMRCS